MSPGEFRVGGMDALGSVFVELVTVAFAKQENQQHSRCDEQANHTSD
jgi:hypothetical protein